MYKQNESIFDYGDVKSETAFLYGNALDLGVVVEKQNAALFESDLVGNAFGCDGEVKRGEAHVVKSAVSAVFGEGHHAGNGALANECDDIRLIDVKREEVVCHAVFSHGFLIADLDAVFVKGHDAHACDADVVLLGILAFAAHDICENFEFYLLFFFHG